MCNEQLVFDYNSSVFQSIVKIKKIDQKNHPSIHSSFSLSLLDKANEINNKVILL